MVGTIGLAGSKARIRGNMAGWWRGIGGSYVLAAAAGGLVLGLAASFVGLLLRSVSSPSQIVVAIGLVLLGTADLFGLPAKHFSRARQVPLSWKHVFPPSVSAPLYGLLLGTGLSTSVYFWNFYGLMLIILAASPPTVGVVAGLGFGLGRALPVVLAALTAPNVAPRQPADSMFNWVQAHRRMVRILAASMSFVGAFAVVGGFHGQ